MYARTCGAADLLKKHGSRLKVAEAFLQGNLEEFEEPFADEVLSPIVLEVARMRLARSGEQVAPVRTALRTMLDTLHKHEIAGYFDRDYLLLVEDLAGYKYNPEGEGTSDDNSA